MKTAVYICGDGPGSYNYEGHECQRRRCAHVRAEHKRRKADKGGAIGGHCTVEGCGCRSFKEIP